MVQTRPTPSRTPGRPGARAHRSYKGTAPYRTVVMLIASIANQGNIFHWVRDHRTHHLHSETVADPHDAGRGMLFAHIGWLYLKKDPRVVEAGKRVNVDDLYADGPVMFQRALDPWWSMLMCFGFPALTTGTTSTHSTTPPPNSALAHSTTPPS